MGSDQRRPQFEFDSATRRRLGEALIERINRYFDGLPDQPVQLPREKRSWRELTEKMPELGEEPQSVLDSICSELIEQGFHVPSANYFGLMNPTPTYMAVLAEMLVSALNPQLASLARSQLASKIENETVRWIGERVGWAGAFDGTFTSGGNEANLSALALALTYTFPASVEEGVASIGAQPVVYCSTEAHHSLDKSCGLLGLGRKALRRLPVRENLQLDVARLQAAIRDDLAAGRKPFCVVATAGTTNSGAIDDLAAIAEVCREHGLWMHIDGAYGAAAIFSDRHRALVSGIERADSITLDPHKWLCMPFAAGVVLTSHPQLLESTFGVHTPYMPKSNGATHADNFKVSTQWSRRMNSLKVWMTLRTHGRQGYEALIARQLELGDHFRQRMTQSAAFELFAPQRLPIVNLRLRMPDAPEQTIASAHERIVEEVTRSGERWISTTRAAGHSVLRVMVISYLTEERHLDELAKALEAAVPAVVPRSEPATR